MTNALYKPNPHQSYDEEMLSTRQPGDPTPWWLQRTLNVPYNALAILSNAVPEAVNAFQRGTDPRFAPDPRMPTPAGDNALARRSVDYIGNTALAAMPAAMAFRGGNALGALAGRTEQASPFAVLKAAEVRSSPDQMFQSEQLAKVREDLPAEMSFAAYHGSPVAGSIIDSGRFRPGQKVSGVEHDLGPGVYFSRNVEDADFFTGYGIDDYYVGGALRKGEEPKNSQLGHEGRSNVEAGSGVIPVELKGRFKDMNDPKIVWDRRPLTEINEDLAKAGYHGGYAGDEYVVFPQSQGKGVVKSATTGKTLFSDSRQSAPAALTTEDMLAEIERERLRQQQLTTY